MNMNPILLDRTRIEFKNEL